MCSTELFRRVQASLVTYAMMSSVVTDRVEQLRSDLDTRGPGSTETNPMPVFWVLCSPLYADKYVTNQDKLSHFLDWVIPLVLYIFVPRRCKIKTVLEHHLHVSFESRFEWGDTQHPKVGTLPQETNLTLHAPIFF